jgi:putative solute:sodium symporter small subunit
VDVCAVDTVACRIEHGGRLAARRSPADARTGSIDKTRAVVARLRFPGPRRCRVRALPVHTTANNPTGSTIPMTPENRAAYWRANIRLLVVLLVIWFAVSYGFGILLVEPLNAIRLGGYKLGFWFAQQGSIYVFLVLIFVYAFAMNRLDKKFDVHED